MHILQATEKLEAKKNLTAQEMQLAMEEIMSGKVLTEAVVDFLLALSEKKETIEEITVAAKVMRQFSLKVKTNKEVVLDTCGTGGDKKGTFNISTLVAFVVSGAGVTVAKHGNRSASSICGSADILESLDIKINLSIESIEKTLDKIGIAFLFAQAFHPSMKFAMPARKQIGKRTIFNILGPLSNPAGATHQLVGVFELGLTKTLACVLGNLGIKHAMVVHGQDGLDEISTADATSICEFVQGQVKEYVITPEDFGFKRISLEKLKCGEVSENLKIFNEVINGVGGAHRDIVLLNAGAALYTADKVLSIKEGIELAKYSIDSKKALEKLNQLREYSK